MQDFHTLTITELNPPAGNPPDH